MGVDMPYSLIPHYCTTVVGERVQNKKKNYILVIYSEICSKRTIKKAHRKVNCSTGCYNNFSFIENQELTHGNKTLNSQFS